MLRNYISLIRTSGRIFFILFLLILFIFAFLILPPSLERTTPLAISEVTVIPGIENTQMMSCYSVPILSSSKNDNISTKIVKLNSIREYQKYCDRYKDIEVLFPLNDDSGTIPLLYRNDYVGIVITSSDSDPKKLLYTSYSYIDEDTCCLYIALIQRDIPESWLFNQDLSKCRQSSTIAFIRKDDIQNTMSISTYML